jgi:CRISPR-associated protein Csx3
MVEIKQKFVGCGILFEVDIIGNHTNAELVEFANNIDIRACGNIAFVNGRCSLPLAYVLAHKLLHNFANVAIFDPKLSGYVVVSSHGGLYSSPGAVIGIDGKLISV